MSAIPYLVIAACLLPGCDGPTNGADLGSAVKLAAGIESDFVIRVEGTAGMAFTGTYLVMKANGSSTQKSVQGKVPAQFPVHGTIVSANAQKQRGKGTLVMIVLRDGKEASRSDTEAAYGVVSVATR